MRETYLGLLVDDFSLEGSDEPVGRHKHGSHGERGPVLVEGVEVVACNV